MMTRDEISKVESGFFLPVYDTFVKGLVKINSAIEEDGRKISLHIEDNFKLNARAKK